ncbi:hypothetical protein E0Z10_g2613 [Xylaria hypoxylon]|uniref:Uncharacterized protein n=1 Tax=Xylaria hypoxylon TaxID=37992 RepID=A0A4Z0ZBW8_9PEZI|nr:hypothetical protein E0Z10_g2613 [Xylaria hypoxylon]
MVAYRLIAIASFLASVNALPLNINLGAYSPALVVGDGEISFGGGQDVTNLLNALEGAAVTSAAANNAASNDVVTTGAAQDIQALGTPSKATPAKDTTDVVAQAIETPVVTPDVTAAAADPNPEQGNLRYFPKYEGTKLTRTVGTQTGLQGMGKEIAPREGSEQAKAKRDLSGFDRALTFAEAALTKGPIIQLGTGEGGAGVGIIVDNRPNAAAVEGEATAKRDEASLPRRRTKVTRMYLKRGIPAGKSQENHNTPTSRRYADHILKVIQSSPKFETRSVDSSAALNLPALSKRDSADTIDAINLNIPGDEGVTMTFVETSDSDDDDEAQEVVASR